MKFTFGIREHIKKSWALYKEYFGLMIIFALIYGFVQVMSQMNQYSFFALLTLFGMVASAVLGYIWIRAVLALLGGDTFKPFTKEMLPSGSRFWDYIKTNLLMGLFVFIGFLLLILPGVYVAGRLSFATYLSVEKAQGARKSVRESWEMTRGYGWMLVWKSVLIAIFGVIGIIALGFGILATMPMAQIMKAMLYKKFKTFSQGDVVPVEPASETTTEATTTPHAEETTVEKVIE